MKETFANYSRLPTEQPNPASRDLDLLSPVQLAELMNKEDARTAQAVRAVLKDIVKGVDLISAALRAGGRLHLAGAGTSGRLCVMEAAECPPTFSTPPGMVQAHIAGGAKAVFRSQEGAEDRGWEAERIVRTKVKPGDALVGVAASGVTPFVLMALNSARRKKVRTVLVTCNPSPQLKTFADVVVALSVGPEIISGSTRLKAGTATKLALNMLTTLSMVRLGKVYGHWMVDLQPRSQKLKARAFRLVRHLGGVTEPEAERLLKSAGGRVKTAILMAKKNLSRRAAEQLLREKNGFLHRALEK